jgi:hypothetical protein
VIRFYKDSEMTEEQINEICKLTETNKEIVVCN